MASRTDALAIDLHHVTKTYRRKIRALRGIRMRVYPGEVFGLLGPNGAGKTTLVKIILTVVRPSRAQGTVLGRPLGDVPTLAKIGYLPENHRFPPYLSGRQALEYYAALAKVDRPTRRRRAAELLRLVGMSQWAKTKVGAYSKGMQQRLSLAQALVNDPQLVVLDEPTDGLDPVGRREVREVLRQLRDQGKTVFLNSHLLGEVERLCDRVAILVQGSVQLQGTLDELTAGSQHYEIELCGSVTDGMIEAVRAALPCPLGQAAPAGEPSGAGPGPGRPVERGTLPGGETVELDGTRIRIYTGEPAGIQPILDGLRRRHLVIQAVRPVRQSLEDFFIAAVSNPQDRPPTAEAAGPGEAQ